MKHLQLQRFVSFIALFDGTPPQTARSLAGRAPRHLPAESAEVGYSSLATLKHSCTHQEGSAKIGGGTQEEKDDRHLHVLPVTSKR